MLLVIVRLISRPLLACKCGNNLLLLLLLLLPSSSSSSSSSSGFYLHCVVIIILPFTFYSVQSLCFFGGIEVGTKKIVREDSQHAAQDSNRAPSG
jgi:hypothetical protein